eukprot:1219812-Lingulodinium_polyedra.AAC.1
MPSRACRADGLERMPGRLRSPAGSSNARRGWTRAARGGPAVARHGSCPESMPCRQTRPAR